MSAATVIRLRSRCDSSARSQTSPNSTSSVSSANLGAKSPMSCWARDCASGSDISHLLFCSLLVADLFHPVRGLAVEIFLNGDVGHGCGRRSAVPVLLARQDRDHIT